MYNLNDEIACFDRPTIYYDEQKNKKFKKVIFKRDVCVHDFAFFNCTNLEIIEFNSLDNVVYNYAFRNCENLRCISFSLNNKLAYINIGDDEFLASINNKKIVIAKKHYDEIRQIYIDETLDVKENLVLHNISDTNIKDGILKLSKIYDIIDIFNFGHKYRVLDLSEINAKKLDISIPNTANKIIMPKKTLPKNNFKIYNYNDTIQDIEIVFKNDISFYIENFDSIYADQNIYFINYKDIFTGAFKSLIYDYEKDNLHLSFNKCYGTRPFETFQMNIIDLIKLKTKKNINIEELEQLKLILEHFDEAELLSFTELKEEKKKFNLLKR